MAIPRERTLGRYELLLELARGGMAELFLGRLVGAGGFSKLVAIKRILPHLAQDRQFTEMFLNEGRIASRLSHPNICQVFELGESNGELFLAMEYLEGASWDTLSSLMPRASALPLTVAVLSQAAEGLHDAHTLCDASGAPTPVVHRDVSPQNLFVTVDGICKVLDFGVSKMMTDGPRTRTGVVKGKLPYMAPEQIRGEPVDARADIFSLGVCAWEALAGRRLFDRETDFQIWKAVTEDPIPPLSSFFPSCPPALESTIHRALSRSPSDRPATARAFGDALRSCAPAIADASILSATVRTLCAPHLADRSARVATALTSPPPGLALRPASVAILRSAASTVDAMPSTPVDTSAATLDFPPPPSPPPPVRRSLRRTRGRSDLTTALLAGGFAAALTAIIVAVVLTRPSPSPRRPAPPDPAPLSDQLHQSLQSLDRLDDLRDGLSTLRDRLTPLIPTTFTIDSDPPASIYSGDTLLGTTPLTTPLPPGKHTLRAILPDGRSRTLPIDLAPNTETDGGTLTW